MRCSLGNLVPAVAFSVTAGALGQITPTAEQPLGGAPPSGVMSAGEAYAPAQFPRPLTASAMYGIIAADPPVIAATGEIDISAVRAQDAFSAAESGLLRIGVGRGISLDQDAFARAVLDDGSVLFTADVAMADAAGVRLRFRGVDLGPGVRLTVSAPGADAAIGVYEGQGPFGDGEFWTPTIWGSTVRIEAHLSREALVRQGAEPRFSVDGASHIYRATPLELLPGDALACTNSAACWPSWNNVGKAVARYSFVETTGETFVCTGQLLNTVANDLTPYLLTANHCISTDAVARTAEFTWFYGADTCNGSTADISAYPTSIGASVVKASSWSDYSLLMVLGSLPPGVRWVGWTGAAPADGTPSVIVHHPGGAPRAITFGASSTGPSCRISPNFGRFNLSSGVIELGSSGAGFYRADTQQLYGQVFGSCVPLDCSMTYCVYGKFSASLPYLQQWLNAGPDDQFGGANNSCAAAAPIQPGVLNNLVLKSAAPDWYRVTLPAGRLASLRTVATPDYGNIGLTLYRACGGAPVASAAFPGAASQSIGFTPSATGDYFLSVAVLDNVRNTYSLTFGIAGACLGDANGDGRIDLTDLNIILSNFGASGAPGLTGDVNADGIVDFNDLNLTLVRFGSTC